MYGDIRDRLLALPEHPWEDPTSSYLASDVFPMKHGLLAAEAPDARRVFEFGAYYGYFLVAALDACPHVRTVEWVDDESYTAASNRACLRNLMTVTRGVDAWGSRSIRAFLAGLAGDRLPRYDVVHVDGDHSYAGCLTDLTLALAMQPQLLLVDDYTTIPDVRRATDDLAARHQLDVEPLETVNGLAVMRPRHG